MGLARVQELPAAERGRLKAYPQTLSEWRATRQGWRGAFAADPLGTEACLVQERVEVALGVAGVQSKGPRALDCGGPRGAAFRAAFVGRPP